MSYKNQLSLLSSASYFDKTTLQQVIRVSDNSLYSNIKRWIKNGDLIQLKRGLYTTKEYYQKANQDLYAEFIANKIKIPSYLSLEYILQKYSILSESVFSITSITRKNPNTYQNRLGYFSYTNISDRLFTGYQIINKEGYEIKQATKPKALFDYLYSKLFRYPSITKQLIQSMRLNLEEFSDSDFQEYSKYAEISKISKFKKLTKILQEVKNDI